MKKVKGLPKGWTVDQLIGRVKTQTLLTVKELRARIRKAKKIITGVGSKIK